MVKTTCKAVVVAALACMAGAAWAQSAPKAYYTNFCSPDCIWDAQQLYWVDPAPDSPYLVLGTMKLPYGKYMVTSKITAYAEGDKTSVMNLECILYNTVDSTTDWTDIAFQTPWGSAPLFFQMPVNVTSYAGGTVGVKCRGMGHQDADPNLPAKMHVWGGNLAAVQVSSITRP
jgi:hypothetical protein